MPSSKRPKSPPGEKSERQFVPKSSKRYEARQFEFRFMSEIVSIDQSSYGEEKQSFVGLIRGVKKSGNNSVNIVIDMFPTFSFTELAGVSSSSSSSK